MAGDGDHVDIFRHEIEGELHTQYSMLNPQASSLSDSGMSKGIRFISARPATR